jgi:hypothetical protein
MSFGQTQVTDIDFARNSHTQLALFVKHFNRIGLHVLAIGVQCLFNFTNIFFSYVNVEKLVGPAWLQIINLSRFKPYTHLEAFMY